MNTDQKDLDPLQHQDVSLNISPEQKDKRADGYCGDETLSSDHIGKDLAATKLTYGSSTLDPSTLGRMQDKVSPSNAAEMSSQTMTVVPLVGDSHEGPALERHQDQSGASSPTGPSRKSERMNRRKRKKPCLGITEHLVSEPSAHSASELEPVQQLNDGDLRSREERSDTETDLTGSVMAWNNQNMTDCNEEARDSLAPKEGSTGISGMRFQALNAEAGVMKKSSSIFGMMSKFGERKRYVCDDCGRSFNQVRVFNVHKQMHLVKKSSNFPEGQRGENLGQRSFPNSEMTEKEGSEESLIAESKGSVGNRTSEISTMDGVDTRTSVISESSFTAEEEIKNHEVGKMPVHSLPTGEDGTSSNSCLQDAVTELPNDTNHERAAKRSRKKDKNEAETESLELRNEPNFKGYTCNVCQKVFNLPSFLRRHQLVHTGEKLFACKYCGKSFGQKATRDRHEATHGRDQPHLCQACGDGFSSSEKLELHVKRKHTDEYHEDESKPKRKRHKRKHKSEKDATLELDEAKDIANEELESIGKTHGTEVPQCKEEMKVYACQVCSKTFNQQSHLNRHRLIHTGEKPFSCKECGKGFSQKGTCLRHERSHTGELPYICPECGNGYAQKSGLRIHRLIHTGERPHKCRFCEASFTQKVTRMRHERIHTGERPFVCLQCGKAFGQSASLERHVKNLHSSINK